VDGILAQYCKEVQLRAKHYTTILPRESRETVETWMSFIISGKPSGSPFVVAVVFVAGPRTPVLFSSKKFLQLMLSLMVLAHTNPNNEVTFNSTVTVGLIDSTSTISTLTIICARTHARTHTHTHTHDARTHTHTLSHTHTHTHSLTYSHSLHLLCEFLQVTTHGAVCINHNHGVVMVLHPAKLIYSLLVVVHQSTLIVCLSTPP